MSTRPYVDTCVFLGGISADVRTNVDRHTDEYRPIAWGYDGTVGPGGRAAMAAAGAVKLGRRFVDLVGCVGDDIFGSGISNALKDAGVATRLVGAAEGTPTGIRQIVVDAAGRRRVVSNANANAMVGEAQMRKADSTIFGADLLFATLEVPYDTVRSTIITAAQRGVPVLLNAAPLPTFEGVIDLGKRMLSHVDVLLVNWNAAAAMADMVDVSGPTGLELGKRLLRMGPKAVIITLGEHGSIVAADDQHTLVEPYQVRTVDAALAGDAYAAGLAVGLTSQARGNFRWEHLVNAAKYASAAAAVAVSRPGGFEALPTKQEVERLMATQQAGVRRMAADSVI